MAQKLTFGLPNTVERADTLEVYGYMKVGFVKMGRNTTWTRVSEEG